MRERTRGLLLVVVMLVILGILSAPLLLINKEPDQIHQSELKEELLKISYTSYYQFTGEMYVVDVANRTVLYVKEVGDANYSIPVIRLVRGKYNYLTNTTEYYAIMVDLEKNLVTIKKPDGEVESFNTTHEEALLYDPLFLVYSLLKTGDVQTPIKLGSVIIAKYVPTNETQTILADERVRILGGNFVIDAITKRVVKVDLILLFDNGLFGRMTYTFTYEENQK